MTARLVANARESRCLVRRFVLPTSLADRTANQRAQKATSDRLSSSSSSRLRQARSEEHTSELQSRQYLVCRLLLEKKKQRTVTFDGGDTAAGSRGSNL